jgi:hypothetical protein
MVPGGKQDVAAGLDKVEQVGLRELPKLLLRRKDDEVVVRAHAVLFQCQLWVIREERELMAAS